MINVAGTGGNGGVLTADNYGSLIMRSDASDANGNELFGIRLNDQGGDGAAMSGGAGDQKGGNRGGGKQLTVTNDNGATICPGHSETRLLATLNGARAITLFAGGGEAGSENGAGGVCGTITASNGGVIDMYLDTRGAVSDP